MAPGQVDDAAFEGSSFLRHFNFDYLRLDTLPAIECKSILSPTSGYYRSTSQSDVFPFLDNKNVELCFFTDVILAYISDPDNKSE